MPTFGLAGGEVSCDFEYAEIRLRVYGAGAQIIPVCETCGRFVKADNEVLFDHEEQPRGPNATCSKHGRVQMIWQGWYRMTQASEQEAAETKEVNLLKTTDPLLWAKQFVRMFPEIDQALMLTWFANAIICGHESGIAHARREMEGEIKELKAALEKCAYPEKYHGPCLTCGPRASEAGSYIAREVLNKYGSKEWR